MKIQSQNLVFYLFFQRLLVLSDHHGSKKLMLNRAFL